MASEQKWKRTVDANGNPGEKSTEYYHPSYGYLDVPNTLIEQLQSEATEQEQEEFSVEMATALSNMKLEYDKRIEQARAEEHRAFATKVIETLSKYDKELEGTCIYEIKDWLRSEQNRMPSIQVRR